MSKMPNLKTSRSEVEEFIKHQLSKGSQLFQFSSNPPIGQKRYDTWDAENREALEEYFDSPELAEEYSDVTGLILPENNELDKIRNFEERLRQKSRWLSSLLNERLPWYKEALPTLNMTELHPWPVICSILFDSNSSDNIINIIGLTGLNVDWNLTEQERYSHGTRKRAYRPRVQAAYEQIPDEKKLAVAWIVAKELATGSQETEGTLQAALAHIGWKLEADRLTTDDVNIRELFFPKGKYHDAYVEIRTILQSATHTVLIVDGYLDSSIFQMLTTIPSAKLQVQFLSSSKISSDFSLESKKFQKQHSHLSVETKLTKDIHDRFIILDNQHCYHLGASIKDAGNKVFMISKIEEQHISSAVINELNQIWTNALPHP
jgi:hypothetical protein